MDYLAEIEKVIEILRETYANDNTFRGYVNAISVLLSRIDDYKKQHQIAARVNTLAMPANGVFQAI